MRRCELLAAYRERFALLGSPPASNADIISAATELYRRWLFEPSATPPPVAANQDLFFLEILKHTSLLFQPRTALAKEVVPVHVKLCEAVLELYRRLAKDVPLSKVRFVCRSAAAKQQRL